MTSWSRRDWVTLLLLSGAALLAFLYSESVRYGDSTTYALQLARGIAIEPGHLIWRPLSVAMARALGLTQTPSDLLWAMQYLSLIASILTVVAVYCVARNYWSVGHAAIAAILVLVSNGFWNYSYSGCSYTLSVLFGTIAWYFVARPTVHLPTTRSLFWNALGAGVFSGLSTATWGIQVICVPTVWLGLMLVDRDQVTYKARLIKTALFAIGVAIVLVMPLFILYEVAGTLGLEHYVSPNPSEVDLLTWIKSANHGLSPSFGVSQILRVFVGYPQSIVSTGGVAQQLRLWLYGDTPFPASTWVLVLAGFYAFAIYTIVRLVRARRRMSSAVKTLVACATVAIVLNLGFALVWQGTDLERYFPSLPYQALLVGVFIVHSNWRPSTAVIATSLASLAAVASINWIGTLRPILAADSFRASWLAEIRRVADEGDLILVFGNRKRQIESPHDARFPKVIDVSFLINIEGDRWRSAVSDLVNKTRESRHHIYLGDSLLVLNDAPRDGWSFKQNPHPSPRELAEFFGGLRSERVAFSVFGERVWQAKEMPL